MSKPKPMSARVAVRPDPKSWDMDELMTLKEAVDLHWPDGPLTIPTLRTAIRDGKLPVCSVAGKFFLTRRALLALSEAEMMKPTSPRASWRPNGTGMSLEEARLLAGV